MNRKNHNFASSAINKFLFIFLSVLVFSFSSTLIAEAEERLTHRALVKLGIEVLLEKNLHLLRGKKVALVTNLTGVDSRLRSSIDCIYSLPDVKLVALFGPEHSIKGGVQGVVGNTRDIKTGVPVYSLYGKKRGLRDAILKNIHILLFDIQDIGSRTYTYISTMKMCMEAAARNKIRFIVLDRPNPINGLLVDGPVLESKFTSFIGVGPIAYVHGMTVGELALYFNREFKILCDLEVIPMEGWKRRMTWEDTRLIWVPSSPHIPEMDTPWFYPITGILGEINLVSVGVGYTMPFKIVGAPWIDGERLAKTLNKKNLPGVYFQPFYFKPYYQIFQNEFCEGIRIIITDKQMIKPVSISYHIIEVLLKLYPEEFNFTSDSARRNIRKFDCANGTDRVRLMLERGMPADKIVESYQADIEKFKKKRRKYLLYQE